MIAWLRGVRGTPTTAEAWLALRRTGRWDAAHERAFEAWIAADPEHARRYALCELAWHLGGPAAERLPGVAASPPARARTGARTRALAAALVAAILVAIAGYRVLPPPDVPAPQHYSTGAGEQRTVILEDGSRVTLNTRTHLSASFRADARELVLQSGEAYFEVTQDAARPFRVATALGVITVVGTRFGAYRTEQSLEVATLDGVVRVASAGLPPDAGTVLVGPGQNATITTADARPRLRAADLRRIDNWRRQRIEVDTVPLATLLEEFSRYTVTPVSTDDEEIAALEVSAVLRIGDVDALARTLKAAYGLRMRDTGAGRIVVERSHSDHRAERGR